MKPPPFAIGHCTVPQALHLDGSLYLRLLRGGGCDACILPFFFTAAAQHLLFGDWRGGYTQYRSLRLAAYFDAFLVLSDALQRAVFKLYYLFWEFGTYGWDDG